MWHDDRAVDAEGEMGALFGLPAAPSPYYCCRDCAAGQLGEAPADGLCPRCRIARWLSALDYDCDDLEFQTDAGMVLVSLGNNAEGYCCYRDIDLLHYDDSITGMAAWLAARQ